MYSFIFMTKLKFKKKLIIMFKKYKMAKNIDNDTYHKVIRYREMINNKYSVALRESLREKCARLNFLKNTFNDSDDPACHVLVDVTTMVKNNTKKAFNRVEMNVTNNTKDYDEVIKNLNACKNALQIEKMVIENTTKINSMLYVGKFTNNASIMLEYYVETLNGLIKELTEIFKSNPHHVEEINKCDIVISDPVCNVLYNIIIDLSTKIDSHIEECSILKSKLIVQFKPIYECIGLNDDINVSMLEYFDKLKTYLDKNF
jgi:hypothetical protein